VGGTTSYTTTSDRRLKTDFAPIKDALGLLRSLQAREFRMVADESGQRVTGFLADEMQRLAPWGVIGKAGAVDESGSPIYQTADYAKLIPFVWAAVAALDEVVTATQKRVLNLELAA
jgi:hypothetical protein